MKGVATHADPESCVRTGNCAGEALTGARAGQVLSRERKINSGRPTVSYVWKAIWDRSLFARTTLRYVRINERILSFKCTETFQLFRTGLQFAILYPKDSNAQPAKHFNGSDLRYFWRQYSEMWIGIAFYSVPVVEQLPNCHADSFVLDVVLSCSAAPLRAEVGNGRKSQQSASIVDATRLRFLHFGVLKSVSTHDKWAVSVF